MSPEELLADEMSKTLLHMRELLDSLYATSNLVTIEELADKVAQCVEIPFSFLIYIREDAWFSESECDPPKALRFAFLSFEYNNGNLARFKDRFALDKRELELEGCGYTKEERQLCSILYKTAVVSDCDRVVSLLTRILVAFYKNCGSYEHFRESVASRYVHEFFKGRKEGRWSDLSDVLRYIRSSSNLNVSLFKKRDDMYFSESNSADRMISCLEPSDTELPEFFMDSHFCRDLFTSVTRRSQTFGSTRDLSRHYVIKTFASRQNEGESENRWASFRSDRQIVAVFSAFKTTALSLDAFYHANRLIGEFLHSDVENRSVELLFNADERYVVMEGSLADSPFKRKSEFNERLSDLLAPIFSAAIDRTKATGLVLWVYEPFSDQLVPVAKYYRGNYRDSLAPLSCADDLENDHIATRAFLTGHSIRFFHETFVEREIMHATRMQQVKKLEYFSRKRSERASTRVSMITKCAALGIPVWSGANEIGVLEVVSTDSSDLRQDGPLLGRLAYFAGDSAKRLLLANDRAWMSRMSFVHAARHRIESIRRDLEESAPGIARKFSQIFEFSQEVVDFGPEPKEVDDFQRLLSRIRSMFAACGTVAAATRFIDGLIAIKNECGYRPHTFAAVADIVDTLASNRAHSDFRSDDLRIDLDPGRRGRHSVRIRYAPSGVLIQAERLDQMCVSPIKDEGSLTYHYGLFLLATHIRMLGGYADCSPSVDTDGLGNGVFGLTFSIPVI